tara:strand:- start:399 stop:977 length:579 start_codon:yes stop_codon:yes gene_type:complete
MVIEELKKRSKLVPFLIDMYKKGDSNFSRHVIEWLEKNEEIMSKLHLSEGGEMSVLRSRILKFTDVYRPADERLTQSALRKGKNAETASVVERAEEIIRIAIQESEERLLQFENKLCEGMTAFLLENELPPQGRNYMGWLNQIWQMIKAQGSTRALAMYISASLVAYDRTYILDKVISRLSEDELQAHQRLN